MSLRKAVKDVLDAIDQKGYVNTKNKKDEVRIEALRQAYAEPYVPMSIFECYDVAASFNADSEHLSLVAHIEAAVLARMGIEVKS